MTSKSRRPQLLCRVTFEIAVGLPTCVWVSKTIGLPFVPQVGMTIHLDPEERGDPPCPGVRVESVSWSAARPGELSVRADRHHYFGNEYRCLASEISFRQVLGLVRAGFTFHTDGELTEDGRVPLLVECEEREAEWRSRAKTGKLANGPLPAETRRRCKVADKEAGGLWRYREGGGKYLVRRRDGTVPEWPYFVLGARDPVAAGALRAYADLCISYGMNLQYASDIFRLADEFDAYIEEHGAGDPEARPHRRDDPDVATRIDEAKGA